MRRHKHAYALIERHPELNPDTAGLGPEARCDDAVIAALLGKDPANLGWQAGFRLDYGGETVRTAATALY